MSRRRIRYQTESLAEINMTNLIDVTMVLLIIFILVSNFVTTGLNITVPKVPYVQPSGKEHIVVGIDVNGSFTINAKPVTLQEIESRLTELHKEFPEEGVFVQADHLTSYSDVSKVITMAQKAGYPKINLPMTLDTGAK